MKRYAVIAALALTASACGSSGGSSDALYTKAATGACLSKAGLKVKPVTDTTDFVASSATGGALRVYPVGNEVTISFGAQLEDATNLQQAYERFHSENVGLADVLRTQQNAVMLWHEHPSDNDLADVTNCLK
jgi:hypothetical protein